MKNLTGVDLSQYERKKLIKYIAKQGDYVLAMTGATIGKMGRIEESEAYETSVFFYSKIIPM